MIFSNSIYSVGAVLAIFLGGELGRECYIILRSNDMNDIKLKLINILDI